MYNQEFLYAMGDARNASKRAGAKKKGPRARAAEDNESRDSRREWETERKRKWRQQQLEREENAKLLANHEVLEREREEEAMLLPTTLDSVEEASELSSRKVCQVVSEIVNFFMSKLQACSTVSTRLKIMECFLEDELIKPFLPKYYPCKQDALVQFELLQNYQHELEAVKGAQSADKLARKAVLLDAAVSTHGTNIKDLSRILRVNPPSLRRALRRKIVRLETTPFALAKRKRRPGMSEETKDLVVKWWTQETRVSPNRKDTVQKWISPKTYETHCTHYLLETQVSDADSYIRILWTGLVNGLRE